MKRLFMQLITPMTGLDLCPIQQGPGERTGAFAFLLRSELVQPEG